MAACTLTPTAGDDTYVCDSGTSPGLSDLSGNNRLTMPANGSGVIQGDITFGAGTDYLEVNPNGVFFINSQQVDSAGLPDKLKSIYDGRPDKVLFVKGAESLPYGEVVGAVDASRQAGVQVIGLVPRS